MSEWTIKVHKSPDVRVSRRYTSPRRQSGSLRYTSPKMSEYHEDTQVPKCQSGSLRYASPQMSEYHEDAQVPRCQRSWRYTGPQMSEYHEDLQVPRCQSGSWRYTSPQMSEYHEDTQVPSCQTIVKDKVTQVPGIAESVSLSHTSPGYHSECIIKLHKYQVSLSVYK